MFSPSHRGKKTYSTKDRLRGPLGGEASVGVVVYANVVSIGAVACVFFLDISGTRGWGPPPLSDCKTQGFSKHQNIIEITCGRRDLFKN